LAKKVIQTWVAVKSSPLSRGSNPGRAKIPRSRADRGGGECRPTLTGAPIEARIGRGELLATAAIAAFVDELLRRVEIVARRGPGVGGDNGDSLLEITVTVY
jgi:hypothetical protein